jgi:transposase
MDRGSFAGIHRCIFVSVCQSPVLAGALAGGACSVIPSRCVPLQEVAGVKVKYERVAGIDVHKDMIKVAVRSPGEGGERATEVLEFRAFYGVLQAVAAMLRLERGVTHVAMEASGVYTEPVYHALCEQPFEQVLVVNPRDVKALKGHKTDARDCRRIAELLECGLLRGSFIPPAEQKEMRDLTRYRKKLVQARTSEIQRLHKMLESAGIKLGSVVSEITGVSATAMIDALIDGERRPEVMAGLAQRSLRQAGKQADLKLALAGRFTSHHAMLCRMHRDQVKLASEAADRLDEQIAAMAAARWQRELDLLVTIPGFGPVTAAVWLAEIGPAPHQWFPGHDKLAAWASLCPGNHVSAGKRRSGRTGQAGTYIKPALIEAAWGAIRVKGRLQARYNRLVRRFGGEKNQAAKKKAITAIAHTLLKIAYQVLKSGQPYTEPGADFYTRRQSPAREQAWLEYRLRQLHPGSDITITITRPPGGPPPASTAQTALPAHP